MLACELLYLFNRSLSVSAGPFDCCIRVRLIIYPYVSFASRFTGKAIPMKKLVIARVRSVTRVPPFYFKETKKTVRNRGLSPVIRLSCIRGYMPVI